MNTGEELKTTSQEEGLEDGEIDSSEEDNVTMTKNNSANEEQLKVNSTSGSTIDLTNLENIKKANICESSYGIYDFADNLEKKMAAILKKEGIVPKIPDIVLEKRKKLKEEVIATTESSQNKSSRRRKRKKIQKEKVREKDYEKVSKFLAKELASLIFFCNFQKRFRSEKTLVEDDIDEDEMLGMRGASPSRKSESLNYSTYPHYSSYLDSDYSKDDSYDSYDSSHDGDKSSKRKRSNKKVWRDKDRDDKKNKRKDDSSDVSDEVS